MGAKPIPFQNYGILARFAFVLTDLPTPGAEPAACFFRAEWQATPPKSHGGRLAAGPRKKTRPQHLRRTVTRDNVARQNATDRIEPLRSIG
jgi:hypothetical protein